MNIKVNFVKDNNRVPFSDLKEGAAFRLDTYGVFIKLKSSPLPNRNAVCIYPANVRYPVVSGDTTYFSGEAYVIPVDLEILVKDQ